MYQQLIKPLCDRILAFLALLVLCPLFLLLMLVVFLDDPGPVFFTQKRVGQKSKNREDALSEIRKAAETQSDIPGFTYFKIYKFRTMKTSTPKDMPTHLLKNPEQYITRMGHFLRKTSLDELPQLLNIAFSHNLSIVGPRPALWNQYDLIAEREKYDANVLIPGLTGYAQANGRDELEIAEKARLDGVYRKKISLFFDIRILFMTVAAVLGAKGVVEGGTGSMKK